MEKLNDSFFYTLEKAVKFYRQYVQSQIKKKGFDITIDQWLVLNTIIDFPEITQTEIAERVFKDKASITRIIELLVQNGYISRNEHPYNRRLILLSLTEHGLSTIEQLKGFIQTFREDALKEISDAQLQQTQHIMKTITENCRSSI